MGEGKLVALLKHAWLGGMELGNRDGVWPVGVSGTPGARAPEPAESFKGPERQVEVDNGRFSAPISTLTMGQQEPAKNTSDPKVRSRILLSSVLVSSCKGNLKKAGTGDGRSDHSAPSSNKADRTQDVRMRNLHL